MKRRFSLLIFGAIMALVLALTAFPAFAEGDNPAERYGATTISGKVKKTYDAIVSTVMKDVPDEEILLDEDWGILPEDVAHAFEVFKGDYPECFWLGQQYSYSQKTDGTVIKITPTYTFTEGALTAAREALENEVSEIMLDLPDGDNYEKALYLHDALAAAVEYLEVGEHQTAYGALVNGKAVCAGYAAAYHLLLSEAGIKAYTVSGNSRSPGGQMIAHAWNIVWIDENTPVYTDVTWDDQEGDLYHCYFNLSRSEIDDDHIADEQIHTLPSANCVGYGYFDNNDLTVLDTTPLSLVVNMFDLTEDGVRSAKILYKGDDFGDWVDINIEELCTLLGGTTATVSRRQLSNEIHITLTGDFEKIKTGVLISDVDNVSFLGNLEQLLDVGSPMTAVTVTADEGYYFPVDYTEREINGISVTRVDYTTLIISGTPTEDLVLRLTAPARKEKQSTPDADFSANSEDTGFLYNVSSDMKYSTDGGLTWKSISGSSVSVSSLSAENGIMIYAPENEWGLESDVQTISLQKSVSPKPIIVAAESALNNDGKIILQRAGAEYRKDGDTTWTTAFDTEVASLDSGVYFVRTKAYGNSLASEETRVLIPSSTDVKVLGITTNETLTLPLEATEAFTYTINPDNALNTVVYITSSNSDIVSVNSDTGALTGLSEGVAEITVTTQDGGFVATCTVTVKCTHPTKTDASLELHDCLGGGTFNYYVCTLCEAALSVEGEIIAELPTKHNYEKTHKYNDTEHWQECSCGEKTTVAAHSFGEWVENGGEKTRACETCSFVEKSDGKASLFSELFDKYGVTVILTVFALIILVIILSFVPKKKKTKTADTPENEGDGKSK